MYPQIKSKTKIETKDSLTTIKNKMIKIPSKSRFKKQYENPDSSKVPVSKSSAGMYSSTGMTISTSKRRFDIPNSQMTNYESVSRKTIQTIGIDKEIEHSSFYL